MSHGRIQRGAWNRRRRLAKKNESRRTRCDHFLFTARTFHEIYDRSRPVGIRRFNKRIRVFSGENSREREFVTRPRGLDEEEGTDRLKLFLLYRSRFASSINTKSTKLMYIYIYIFFSRDKKNILAHREFLTRTKQIRSRLDTRRLTIIPFKDSSTRPLHTTYFDPISHRKFIRPTVPILKISSLFHPPSTLTFRFSIFSFFS